MKRILSVLSLLITIIAFAHLNLHAQCDTTKFSLIHCGFYNEGYRDGVTDANAKLESNYKRHNKIDKKYQPIYREGYEKGYTSVIPYLKWDETQRGVYDKAYKYGASDRKNKISRLPERYEGKYSKSFEAYHRKGYQDGYDNLPKQYDIALEQPANSGGGASNNPPIIRTSAVVEPTPLPLPVATPIPAATPAANVGGAYWEGKVDDRISITIQGSEIKNVDISNTGMRNVSSRLKDNLPLPKRPSEVTVTKLKGRGTVSVIQQPSRSNQFATIIQISDGKKGADDYRLDISWKVDTTEEPYQPGTVYWSGKVDQTARIMVFGGKVDSLDASGSGLYNVFATVNGNLARRMGNRVSVKKTKGRGTVFVSQQPDWENDFTAIVEISDVEKGAGDYSIEISW